MIMQLKMMMHIHVLVVKKGGYPGISPDLGIAYFFVYTQV